MLIHTAGNMWRAEQSSVLFVYLRCITLNCVSHICVSIGKSHSEEACKTFFMERNSLDGTDLSRITLNISLDTEMKHKPVGVCLKNSSCHSHGKVIVFPCTYAQAHLRRHGFTPLYCKSQRYGLNHGEQRLSKTRAVK